MTNSTSDDARDDFILQERLAGRSARSIGKELRCTVGEVDASLDRTLPKIDNDARRRYVALDLNRLDHCSRPSSLARSRRWTLRPGYWW